MKKIPQIIAQSLDDLFVVGGAVRDIILGRMPKEYDLITTTGLGEIKFKTFKESKNGETIGAFIKGVKYDISHYESLDHDLKRRDFTINSMAFPVQKDGEILISHIVDPSNGMKDLKDKILRSFDPYENMKSDPVRILRGLRFISNYDLEVEEKTFDAMKMFMSLVQKVSKERLFLPLDAFVKGKYFSKAFKVAKDLNLEEYLGIPTLNFDIAAKLDPQCRWQAIFAKIKSVDVFKEKVSPPSKVVKSILRMNDFIDQIENQRYDWTIKIKDEEGVCLCQILEVFGINSDIVRRRMDTKLHVTPEMIEKWGVNGEKVAKQMIELWIDILNDK